MNACKAKSSLSGVKNSNASCTTGHGYRLPRCLTKLFSPMTKSIASFTLATVLIGLTLAPWPAAYAQQSEGKIITRSQLGAWALRYDESTPGLNCAIRFIPGKRNADSLAIFGPTAKAAYSALLFSGRNIPPTRSPKEIQLGLHLMGLPESTLKGVIMPKQADTKTYNLMIATSDIRKLLQSMRDSEEKLQLTIQREVIPETIVDIDYDGLDKARVAMLDCIAGRKPGGQDMDSALAEIRPLGKSTIRGSAYYKGGFLASKQYPPKGSEAVALIWMSKEFKAWYEEVKATKKAPEYIPENIAKHIMSTKILDDEGGFSFSRLPAGEYMLIASFTYNETISVPEVVGQTHVFAGNRHIGTQDHVVNWSYLIKEPTTFQKQVTIQSDGEVLDVALDKSQILCFFVCF